MGDKRRTSDSCRDNDWSNHTVNIVNPKHIFTNTDTCKHYHNLKDKNDHNATNTCNDAIDYHYDDSNDEVANNQSQQTSRNPLMAVVLVE